MIKWYQHLWFGLLVGLGLAAIVFNPWRHERLAIAVILCLIVWERGRRVEQSELIKVIRQERERLVAERSAQAARSSGGALERRDHGPN